MQPHPTTKEHREAVLRRLAEMWDKNPYLRLGQLLLNLTPCRSMADNETLEQRDSRWLNRLYEIHNTELVGLE